MKNGNALDHASEVFQDSCAHFCTKGLGLETLKSPTSLVSQCSSSPENHCIRDVPALFLLHMMEENHFTRSSATEGWKWLLPKEGGWEFL